MFLGFILDLCFGDPLWLPHPVAALGRLITALEKLLRPRFPDTPRGQLAAGAAMAFCLLTTAFFAPWFLLRLLGSLHPFLRLGAESLMCYQILAVKSLKDASLAVLEPLKRQDLPAARKAVGRIVGRDTQNLSAQAVTKAAVETVAENAADGVAAPLFFLALGGAPLGFLYKAINTMDSMVGYKNERYLYFGRAAARLDDAANFIPSRLCALAMILAAFLLGLDGRNAWRIFWRDRKKHASPNSAQTEAACAGALGLELAGDASYFGQVVHKPVIGDPLRKIEPEDICRANRLLYGTSALCLIICGALRYALLLGK
ncbi:MAG: adenosylcobinamide-phosphate synthase CbiB [Peptococcaceae bacterium]|nr:adenosylcobinamide-phosphate synthase CbiB [Peptococcaceae bacterium]